MLTWTNVFIAILIGSAIGVGAAIFERNRLNRWQAEYFECIDPTNRVFYNLENDPVKNLMIRDNCVKRISGKYDP